MISFLGESMSAPSAVCSQCGACAGADRIFCEKCGSALRIPTPLISPNAQSAETPADTSARMRRLSKGDAAVFAFFFVVFFLVVHFDAAGRIPRVRHNVPIGTSAWIAVLIATACMAWYKLKGS